MAAKTKDRQTPLHIACLTQDLDEVARHLRSEFVNSKDRDGQTPLMYSCQTGNSAVAEILLKNGADVHLPDHRGRTALHWASFKTKQARLVELLTKAGVNPNAESSDGLTPLHYAVILGFERNARVLLEAGADPKKTYKGMDAAALAKTYKDDSISKLFK